MKKTILILLAALSLHAHASQEDPTGVSAISQDSRLNQSACLRMISATTCESYGQIRDANISGTGNCYVEMSFRLSPNEVVKHKVMGQGYYGNDMFQGPLVVAALAAELVTAGLSDSVLAGHARSESFENALNDLRLNKSTVAENLEINAVAKCADFKDNSATVHRPSESNRAE